MNHTMPAPTVQALASARHPDLVATVKDAAAKPTPGQVAWEAYTAAAGITNGTTWQQLPGDSKARWEATAAAVLDHHQTHSSEVSNA